MADFTLSEEAKQWFRDIRNNSDLEIDFDIYYHCLMAGFASGFKNPNPSSASAFINYFPDKYKHARDLLVGLFLSTEIIREQIDYKDRSAVKKLLSSYIDSNSPTKLNPDGIKELNAYAHGGFEKLQDKFPDRPRDIETFVQLYAKTILKLKRDSLDRN